MPNCNIKIYDISQAVFGCTVYPGDKAPVMQKELRMSRGDGYNLTAFEMNAHNGTHVDAPFHFFETGDTVEQIPLEKTVGYCYASVQEHDIGAAEAKSILQCAKSRNPKAEKRILIKGNGVITEEAARVFADAGIYLLGVEGQSVGPEDAPVAVHQILLAAKTVLLEGIRLAEVKEGVYLLNAAPLCLNGSDGAPCRAILIEETTDRTEDLQ